MGMCEFEMGGGREERYLDFDVARGGEVAFHEEAGVVEEGLRAL